jgi:hypothetical protein
LSALDLFDVLAATDRRAVADSANPIMDLFRNVAEFFPSFIPLRLS